MTGPVREMEEFRALVERLELRGRDGGPFVDAWSFVERGWHPLLVALVRDLGALGWDRRVLQIKEKFGTLRFYVDDRRPEVLDRIERAMEESGTLCERCGKPGGMRDAGEDRVTAWCEDCRRTPRSTG